jgi:hypothetical protein
MRGGIAMVGETISIESWKDSDEVSILDLQKLVFGDGDLASREFFDWQYRQNPSGRALIAIAREPGGKIVAQYVAIPLRLNLDGRSEMGSFAVNAATHPDYRRMNLFVKCAKKLFDDALQAGVTHTFAFPTLYAYLASTSKLGYRDLGLTPLLMKLHNAEVFLSERGLTRPWLPFGYVGGIVLKALQKEPRKIQNVEEVTSFDGLPVERLRERKQITVDVDSRWLNWRYINNPRHKYRIAVARYSREIAGLVVHGIQESAQRYGVIMDLMLSPTAGKDTVESLLHHVFSSHVEAGCSLTLCLASPGSRKERLLRQYGFWNVPKRMRSKGISTGVILHRNNDSLNGGFKLEDLDLMFGMHDVL